MSHIYLKKIAELRVMITYDVIESQVFSVNSNYKRDFINITAQFKVCQNIGQSGSVITATHRYTPPDRFRQTQLNSITNNARVIISLKYIIAFAYLCIWHDS